MNDTGKVLTAYRVKKYKTKKDAWIAVTRAGLNIGYDRYRRLELGRVWPTEQEARTLSNLLSMPLGMWLEGHHSHLELINELEALPSKTRDILTTAIVAAIKTLKPPD